MMPAFDAIIIDFFGTLTLSTPGDVWTAAAAASAEPLGLDPAVWRRALDDSFIERVTGALGDLESSFRVLARRCGVDLADDALLREACRARMESQSTLFTFRDDVPAALKELKARGFRLGLLSDCSPELPAAWPGLVVAEFFDAVGFSCVEGIKKPDPAFYLRVCERLGVGPARCLYVGDGGSRELSGALAVGMTPVMLRAEDWHTNFAHGREDDWAGAEVPSFTALLADPRLSARS